MKKIVMIVVAIIVALILGVAGIFAYRKHQSDACFKETGQDAIAACTRWIEKDGVVPSIKKLTLARRAVLYEAEKALEPALADNLKSLGIKIEGSDLSKRAQAQGDEAALVHRIRLGVAANKPEIVMQACVTLGPDKKAARGLLQTCALTSFRSGSYDSAAKDAWYYLGDSSTDPDMLMLAAISSIASGDAVRTLRALKRMNIAALPAGLRAGTAMLQAEMFSCLGYHQEGLSVVEALMAPGQTVGKADLTALLLSRYNLLSRMGRAVEALPFLDQALSATSDPAERISLQIIRGRARESLGKYKEALADYRSAAVLDPSRISPHRGIGMIMVRDKRLSDAEKEFSAVIQKDRNDPESLLGAAYCSFASRRDRRTAGGFMAAALSKDLSRLSHPKTFKMMLSALMKDANLRTLAKNYTANIRAIPGGPVQLVAPNDLVATFSAARNIVAPMAAPSK